KLRAGIGQIGNATHKAGGIVKGIAGAVEEGSLVYEAGARRSNEFEKVVPACAGRRCAAGGVDEIKSCAGASGGQRAKDVACRAAAAVSSLDDAFTNRRGQRSRRPAAASSLSEVDELAACSVE